ncbi:unnamed protein product, partial [marine sediment metagenome]
CKKKGKVIEFSMAPMKKLPIKIASKECQNPVIRLVNNIFSITKDDEYFKNSKKQTKVKAFEREIDKLVYKLYGLTPEEIKIVERVNENAD